AVAIARPRSPFQALLRSPSTAAPSGKAAASPPARPAPAPRETLQRGVLQVPEPRESDVCMKSGQPFSLTQSRYHCASCGAVCAFDHCSKEVPLPHHGLEAAARVCDDCFVAQQLLLHLRCVSGLFEAHLYEHQRARRGARAAVAKINQVRNAATKFHSSSLQVGLGLLEKGKITQHEFSELVRAEQRFQRDEAANRVHALRMGALGSVGDDMLGLIKLLHDSAQSEQFNAHDFYFIVQALHDLAAKDLDLIDFFWPQVVHTHYLLVPAPTFEAVLKVELLEDFMLALCLQSVHLAVKLIWWVAGYLDDLGRRGRPLDADSDACGKQVCLIRLALEVEDTVITATTAPRSGGGGSGGRSSGGGGGGGSGSVCAADGGEDGDEEGGVRLERRVFRQLLKPTGAQSSLIADQLLLLQQLRRAVSHEFALTYRAKLKMLDSDGHGGGSGGSSALNGPAAMLAASATAGAAGGAGGASAASGAAPTPVLARTASGGGGALAGGGGDARLAAKYFEEQLAFVQELTEIAERLRFVHPVTSRAAHLKTELANLEGTAAAAAEEAAAAGGVGEATSAIAPAATSGNGSMPTSTPGSPRTAASATFPPAGVSSVAAATAKGGRAGSGDAGQQRHGRMPGYLPVCRASDPICPIVRIPISEGYVFKTKERAPTLIVCEVIAPAEIGLAAAIRGRRGGGGAGNGGIGLRPDGSEYGGDGVASETSDESELDSAASPSNRTASESGCDGGLSGEMSRLSFRHHSTRASHEVEELIDHQVADRAGVLKQQRSLNNGIGGGDGGAGDGSDHGSASGHGSGGGRSGHRHHAWPAPGPRATMYPETFAALRMDVLMAKDADNGAARNSLPRGALAAVVGDARPRSPSPFKPRDAATPTASPAAASPAAGGVGAGAGSAG
ncbi:unnamed protein product, partial [Phaeothamnion confervicola]